MSLLPFDYAGTIQDVQITLIHYEITCLFIDKKTVIKCYSQHDTGSLLEQPYLSQCSFCIFMQ